MISIFKLTAAFKADPYDKKVNLGVGAYRDDDAKPWVLPVVRKASERILKDESLDHEYLPITGLPAFTASAAKLILGPTSPAILEERVASVQTISGTGANHLGALFLSRFYKWTGAPRVYLSNPTWANHQAIFRNVGIEPVDYIYYDPKTIGLDFTGFVNALNAAPSHSVFLLHACAHNPTGVDPTREQWKDIASVMLEKKHYAFFDCAYQGFASGDLDNDAWSVRHFVERGVPSLVCQSFAKNAGLYGERVGALHVVTSGKDGAERVKSQLSVLQRSEISNPPTYGARVMTVILTDEELFREWRGDIKTMAERIKTMRRELHRELTYELRTPGSWEHIVQQIGMFSFTGLGTEATRALVERAHIYLTANGRISMAGLNSRNIRYVAASIDAVSDMVAQRPSHIPLPPPRFDPDDTDPPFYTAPSTPDFPSPQLFYTPPSSPPLPSPPALPPTPHDDPHSAVDLVFDLALTDDALSALEKVYLFSRSKAVFHRVFIAHSLPSFLDDVSPQDANEYVLPLLSGLALDDDEQVKEALAAQLVPIIWWFFTHCQVIPDDSAMDAVDAVAEATISVQAFTPILGTLLLSPNPLIGGAARYAVVDLLDRMRKADAHLKSSDGIRCVDDEDIDLVIGFFGPQERALFQEEILQQVVIGMGHLDIDTESPVTPSPAPSENGHPFGVKNDIVVGRFGQSEMSEHQSARDVVNPYFPTIVHNHIDTLSVKQHGASGVDSSTRKRGADDVLSPASRPVIPVDQLNPPKLGRLSPELVDTSPSSSFIGMKGEMEYDAAHNRFIGPSWKCTCNEAYDDSDCEDQKAAVGRLSSMSLMAAVTASGSLDDATKQAFVKEVERVSGDPIPWVRTEASFALGALAKVVPEEVVYCSLLPLFGQLRCDAAWRVRHSVVFALPAILTRLRPHERRKLAIETIICLATDESATVRLGVLEVLGEVLYTFHADEGVPIELLSLFLGRKDGQSLLMGDHPQSNENHYLGLFLQEPKRPLICAFNYPAVVVALGKERWDDVRDMYLSLAAHVEFKVRRTLAASLGEMARIIGEDNAQRDLVQVWWNSIRSEEDEVRLKAVEVVEAFSAALGLSAGASIVDGVLRVWDEGFFKTWRERNCIAKALVNLSRWGHRVITSAIVGLLGRALEDHVASVRESAVAALPLVREILSNQPEFLLQLQDNLRTLANATTYRKRMTFVACQQSLINSNKGPAHILDNDSLGAIDKLAGDEVDGVRIGIARLVGIICEKSTRNAIPITDTLLRLIRRLSHDKSPDVRAYIPDLSKIGQNTELTIPNKAHIHDVHIFSRPPLYQVLDQGREETMCQPTVIDNMVIYNPTSTNDLS
ncbi:hypothetical protein APHAL10511_001258 [Amanita phalloides]|nr:hypothetical protein APHAL10511_001258 [Amanita phalloides]